MTGESPHTWCCYWIPLGLSLFRIHTITFVYFLFSTCVEVYHLNICERDLPDVHKLFACIFYVVDSISWSTLEDLKVSPQMCLNVHRLYASIFFVANSISWPAKRFTSLISNAYIKCSLHHNPLPTSCTTSKSSTFPLQGLSTRLLIFMQMWKSKYNDRLFIERSRIMMD